MAGLGLGRAATGRGAGYNRAIPLRPTIGQQSRGPLAPHAEETMDPETPAAGANAPERPKLSSDEAARELFARFTGRLIGLARTHLAGRLRHKVDPEDVVQSAYKSFFVRYGEETLAGEGWDGLWGLLTIITVRKCADRARYHGADRRDS